jgi:hypothetical protein
MDVLMLFLAGATEKRKAEIAVETTATIGGLDGTYDVTLGPYGVFAGTATIVGKKGAKLTIEDTPELQAAVEGVLLDALATDVMVTAAKAKIVGKQTTGGVKKRYQGKIKYEGTVATGPDAGKAVKGKIKAKGDLED